MKSNNKLLAIVFAESISCVLVERGLYFFCTHRMGFSDTLNLWMALVFGVSYILGSSLTHRVTRKFGEKRTLLATLATQLALLVVLAFWASPVSIFICQGIFGLAYGMMWPVMESYVCANQTPKQMARSVGRFNVSWACSIPFGLAITGPLIELHAMALFAAAAVFVVLAMVMVRPLARRVEHLPHDHPERPDGKSLKRYRGLLLASRSLMLGQYASMWVLAALMPGIFKNLGYSIIMATGLSAIMDVARLGAFLLLRRYEGWHNRSVPIVLATVAIPAGFFMVLFGGDLATILSGELLFGLSAGMAYYASLYYAMVVANASVEAGGDHETLIGLGFAIGPLCGLAGSALIPVLGSQTLGTLVGIGPMFAACGAVAAWGLVSARRPKTWCR